MAASGPRVLKLLLLAVPLGGCKSAELPDPRAAAHAYAEAAARGDADAIHAMLTSEAQRAHGAVGTRKRVQEAREELRRHASALLEPGLRVEATATLPLRDGTNVELSLEPAGFRVASADTLPSGARTPAEALEDLRRALSRRSYPALLRVLSKKARTALEKDLRSLQTGLSDPATLDVRVSGDRAEVEIPGGHAVTLEREDGTWRVDDVK